MRNNALKVSFENVKESDNFFNVMNDLLTSKFFGLKYEVSRLSDFIIQVSNEHSIYNYYIMRAVQKYAQKFGGTLI